MDDTGSLRPPAGLALPLPGGCAMEPIPIALDEAPKAYQTGGARGQTGGGGAQRDRGAGSLHGAEHREQDGQRGRQIWIPRAKAVFLFFYFGGFWQDDAQGGLGSEDGEADKSGTSLCTAAAKTARQRTPFCQ